MKRQQSIKGKCAGRRKIRKFESVVEFLGVCGEIIEQVVRIDDCGEIVSENFLQI